MKNTLSAIIILIILCSCTKNNKPDIVEITKVPGKPSGIPFKNYLGINVFEWDFVENNKTSVITEKRMDLIKSFGGIRHYLDWEKLEHTEGQYTFNPSHSGGWYYDIIYQRTKDEGIDIITCLKTIPDWLINTYPEDKRNNENVPAPYGLDKRNPTSYIKQAKMAFQFAARYGSNKNINPELVTVNKSLRWNGDDPNTVKIGLNLVKYIECDNERDKWWKGKQAEQTPEEYAANLSAFYDGNKGKLGKNVGVKTADPKMMVVMGGLATADPNYVVRMIQWCKKNRGLKNGKVDLCFDVINYHLYANNAFLNNGKATKGVAPELSEIGKVADSFLKMAKNYAPGMEVWLTETGYDIGSKTPQRAIPIGSKTSSITQADWNLRTALLYARHGIQRCMFYMLDDVDFNSPVQYNSSGFHNDDLSPRPSADYMLQTKKLIGNYSYSGTLNNQPIVDLYTKDKKQIYVLVVPDQKGQKVKYQLNLLGAKQAIVHSIQIGKDEMSHKTVSTTNGKLTIEVTETPIFVEKI
ncbi:hypothetical protein [Pedobacter jamesrossensis]|uniref:Glycoside hydrolase family 42 N-terminal domain-containing protein n=1 Tax=Pedobacter jamesrossensis TaxID=1908238 RepID=A0ABV8NGW0_9SPHI